MSRRGRFRRWFLNPGVLSWGLPFAVSMAVLREGQQHGIDLAHFLSAHFLLRLALWVLVGGVLGGNSFYHRCGTAP